jgi:hypothetical protein
MASNPTEHAITSDPATTNFNIHSAIAEQCKSSIDKSPAGSSIGGSINTGIGLKLQSAVAIFHRFATTLTFASNPASLTFEKRIKNGRDP